MAEISAKPEDEVGYKFVSPVDGTEKIVRPDLTGMPDADGLKRDERVDESYSDSLTKFS